MKGKLWLVFLASSVLATSCDTLQLIGDGLLGYKPGLTWQVPTKTGKVIVEVWDNECVDGDIITVSLGGVTKTFELYKEHQQLVATLAPGKYTLKVTAVNGTGYKGNCNFSNENTYAMMVYGEGYTRSTFYSFTAEAGAGHIHNVNVTVE